MLLQIKNALAKKGIAARLSEQRRTRTVHSLRSAHTIALLFDATDTQAANAIVQWGKSLEKEGKTIAFLGFLNKKLKKDEKKPAFDHFTLNDTGFNFEPKAPAATAFAGKKFEMLICLNPQALPALDWVAIQSVASMKVGLATALPNDYDLQLDLPEGAGILDFSAQLNKFGDTLTTQSPPTSKR